MYRAAVRWADLVGWGAACNIYNSSAYGSVSGVNSVGGLVGLSTGSISDSYASGPVTGNSSVGGLVGSNQGTITNSYYNMDTTGQSGGAGTGLTASQWPDLQYYQNGTIGQVLSARAFEAQQEAIFEGNGQQTGGQASFSGQGSNSTGQGLNNQIGSFTPSNTGTVNGTMDNHIVYSDSGSYSATIKSINADGMQFDLEGGSQGGPNR